MMKQFFCISLTSLFALFSTGIHIDLHRCAAEACATEFSDEYGEEHDCCQDKESQDSHKKSSCCTDQALDYHLHDAAFLPSTKENSFLLLSLIPNAHVALKPIEYILSPSYISSEVQGVYSSRPLYLLFDSWKIDC
jgi:hypothetical protein